MHRRSSQSSHRAWLEYVACQSQRMSGCSIALCREMARYSYMIMLQLVSGEAEVLVVGQNNIIVIAYPAVSTWGLCHLQMGRKRLVLFPLQLTAAQGPPIGSQNKIGTSKVSRCRMKCVLSVPEMSNPEAHGAVSPLDWWVSEVLRNRSQLIRGKKTSKAAGCTRKQESFLRRTNNSTFPLLLWKKSKRINSKISVPSTATFP